MASSVRKLIEEASKLSKQDRAILRVELDEMDSYEPQEVVDAAWTQEIERRVRSIEDGTVELLDHDDVMRELRTIVRK